jgi:PRC-barrel domain
MNQESKMQSPTTTAAGTVATDETDRLISSDKVVGTAVYNRRGEHLGSVYNLMVDKHSGQVAYAVMSFGGFLGMGESYHPLPWRVLTYDTRRGGYVVDLDRSRLEAAPSYTSSTAPNWSDRTYAHRVDEFYGVAPYSF